MGENALKNIKKTFRFVLTLLVLGVLGYFICPLTLNIWSALQKYNDRISKQADYTKITTPLPPNVVEDICSKFNIIQNDSRCLPNSVVYGPDFFSDIKSYLSDIDKQQANSLMIQDKLGRYLVMCGDSDNNGNYRCRYDLRGDGIYPIFIYFTKEGNYYRVIANTGGS